MTSNTDWAEQVYTNIRNNTNSSLTDVTTELYNTGRLTSIVSIVRNEVNTPKITKTFPDEIRKQTSVEVTGNKINFRRIHDGEFLDYISTPELLERLIGEDLSNRTAYPIEWRFTDGEVIIDRPETPYTTQLFLNQITPYWRTKDVYELETGGYRHIGGQIKSDGEIPTKEKGYQKRVEQLLIHMRWDCPNCNAHKLTTTPDSEGETWFFQCKNCTHIPQDTTFSFSDVLQKIDGSQSREVIRTQLREQLLE